MINPSLKDLNLSLEELKKTAKLLAEERGIKDYKSMSEDRLLSALISSKPVKKREKPKINFSKEEIEKINKEFNESRDKCSKSKINETRRNLYEIKTKKKSFALKMKKIEENFLE